MRPPMPFPWNSGNIAISQIYEQSTPSASARPAPMIFPEDQVKHLNMLLENARSKSSADLSPRGARRYSSERAFQSTPSCECLMVDMKFLSLLNSLVIVMVSL